MSPIKITRRNGIFLSSPHDQCLIKAINHECVILTMSLQLGLQHFLHIINNYAYPGR